MTKNLILGLILTCFGKNLVPKLVFVGFTSTTCYTLLQVIIVCNFKENQQTKSEKMAKKPYFGPNFDPFVPTPTPTPTPKFFVWILPLIDVRIVATYHFIQFKGKLRKPDLRK